MMNYKEIIEKLAGVEYGYRVYDKANGDMYRKALKNNSEDPLNGVKSKNPTDFGYPIWSEKPMARAPFEYSGSEGLQNLMNGEGTKNFSNYTPLENSYTGRKGGGNYLAGRDSAERMIKNYDNLLSQMPGDYTFNREDYNKKKQLYDNHMAKLRKKRELAADKVKLLENKQSLLDDKLTQTRQTKKDTFFLNIPKRHALKKEIAGLESDKANIVSKIKKAGNPITEREYQQLAQYTNDVYSASDKNAINQYKESLQNSLKDPNNQYYEWGWH